MRRPDFDPDEANEQFMTLPPNDSALDEFDEEASLSGAGNAARHERGPTYAGHLRHGLSAARLSIGVAPLALGLAALLAFAALQWWNMDPPVDSQPTYSRLPPSAAPTASVRTTPRETPGEALAKAARATPAKGAGTTRAKATSGRVPAGDVAGWWMVTNRIDQSRVASFNDLTLGFQLKLDQNGNQVRGQGIKSYENGRPVGARARTPITVDGTLVGDRLELTFTEHGTRRTSHGSFQMQLADDGSLRGRFLSDAGRSRGRSEATRIAERH